MKVIPIERIRFNKKFIARPEGIVLRMNNDETADVKFNIPVTPDKCARCGWPGLLSMNMTFGEVECMRSGCGHLHGFHDVTIKVPLRNLEPLEIFVAKQQKAAWLKELEEKQTSTSSAQNDLEAHMALGREKGWVS